MDNEIHELTENLFEVSVFVVSMHVLVCVCVCVCVSECVCV